METHLSDMVAKIMIEVLDCRQLQLLGSSLLLETQCELSPDPKLLAVHFDCGDLLGLFLDGH